MSKFADHQPLHRQEKIFERHGVEISRKTMGGWMARWPDLLAPLYQAAKKVLFESKVIGTDDTGVKVLDPQTAVCADRPDLALCGGCPSSGRDLTTTRPREGGTGRRNFWKDIQGICRPMPTRSTTHSSNPHAG